ncbi:MAG: two-component sensor histidine kinase [Spongiibacteraceae bacterium]|jgi:two-component system, OmpR family, sensor kinase|nr:two-component sensor histidine kinase [Spongiibacteraceae bacterium]
MTYRSKIALVVGFSTLAVLLAAGLSIWSVRATDKHILQANLAQDLLNEHLQLSVHTYRLFKQLTDEVLLGSTANQSIVRNKRQAIAMSISRIKALEIEQREAIGEEYAPGAVEDTTELEQLIELIIRDFTAALKLPPSSERSQRINAILEERIDVGFREQVNAALSRQRSVVTLMNNRIQTVHTQAMGVAVVLVLITAILGLAMAWLLVRGIAAPLDTLGRAARIWAAGNFDHRIPMADDAEFNQTTTTFNAMADRLSAFTAQHVRTERELQEAVDSQTRELTEANKALERSDNVRRQFFADVSHELRTPLTVIRGEAQVALRGDSRTKTDYQEALEVVLEQAVGLSRLVDDMLFIARTDAERIRLVREPVSANELLSALARESSSLTSGKGITVETDLDESLPPLFVDPSRFRQLLVILIDNAARYTPPEGTITLMTQREGDCAKIFVVDQGAGIDPQDLPHIFDRFFRGSSTHASESPGMGLGLAVAKAIAVAHGGDISADSEIGSGTTMKITLPIRL